MKFSLKWVKLFLVTMVLAVLVVPGYAGTGDSAVNPDPTSSVEPAAEKVVIYGLNNSWNRLMPYDMGGMYSIIPNDKIFDGLAYFDNDTIIGMRAAESMETIDDGYTIVMKLRQDSYWHDGEQVTAQDWLWTLDTMTEPEFEGLASRNYLSPLVGVNNAGTKVVGEKFGVEAPDDFTLIFRLKEPTSYEAFFGSYSYYYRVLPKHLLADIPLVELNEDPFWQNPIGSGPCKFVSEYAGVELTLAAFDDYYLGRPQFDKLIYRVVSPDAFPSGLIAGEFDAGWDTVSPQIAHELEGQNGLHIEKMENTICSFLCLNNEKFTPEMRKGLDMLIDKETIVDMVMLGYGEPAISVNMPSSKYYNTDLVYTRDVAAGTKMLQDAGFDFASSYTIVAANPSREKMALIIQQNFAEAGIKIEIITSDSANLIASLRDGSYDMGILQGTVAANPTWFITQLNNNAVTYARVQDPKYYDAYIAANLAATDEEKIELMWEAQKIQYEECPYICIAHQYIYLLLSEKISNLTVPNNDTPWNWIVN